jgi:quinol monooxygenase YgiN
MSEPISWLLEVAIRPGKLDDFRAVVADLVAATESEPTTLAYEWHLSADGTVCHIYERYQNSGAIELHLQSFGAFAARFMEACQPTRFHIYGDPSPEVKSGLADLSPDYFALIGGFTR